MKYLKKFILESHGIPDSLEIWVNSFYENIVGLTEELIRVKGDPDYQEERTIDGKEKINSYGVILNNDEHFDSTKLFPDNKLKLKGLSIQLELNTLPNRFKEKISNYWEASYNDSESELKDGILYNSEIKFNIFLPEEIMDVENIDIEQYLSETNLKSKIISYISHELTHMYEFFMRKVGGDSEWKEMDTNFINSIFSDYLYNLKLDFMSKSWNMLAKLIYLSSGFEINARIVQTYYRLKHNNTPIKNYNDFYKIFKETLVYDEMKMMSDFDPDEWYKNFEYDEEITQKYLDEQEWIGEEERQKYSTKDLLIKSLLYDWNYIIEVINKKQNKNIPTTPQQYLEDPMLFVKYHNKRIKRYANKLQHKIDKLYTEIIG